jgi:hypothetical protein
MAYSSDNRPPVRATAGCQRGFAIPGRLFGARAAWLGTEILLAESGAAERQLIRRHMAIDVADLAATLMGWQRGYLNRRGALLTGLGAVTAIGLALRASSADPDGSP